MYDLFPQVSQQGSQLYGQYGGVPPSRFKKLLEGHVGYGDSRAIAKAMAEYNNENLQGKLASYDRALAAKRFDGQGGGGSGGGIGGGGTILNPGAIASTGSFGGAASAAKAMRDRNSDNSTYGQTNPVMERPWYTDKVNEADRLRMLKDPNTMAGQAQSYLQGQEQQVAANANPAQYPGYGQMMPQAQQQMNAMQDPEDLLGIIGGFGGGY